VGLIKKSVLLILLYYILGDCYGQKKDTLAYFKTAPDTPMIERFEGIKINKVTYDVVILLKHDSLYVTYKDKNHHVRSFQELDDFIKYVLMNKKDASFAVSNYFDGTYESSKSFDKVAALLKKNKIYDFARGSTFPAAP
jgi:hypothetical protein